MLPLGHVLQDCFLGPLWWRLVERSGHCRCIPQWYCPSFISWWRPISQNDRALQLQDLMKTLKFLLLPTTCYQQQRLECLLATQAQNPQMRNMGWHYLLHCVLQEAHNLPCTLPHSGKILRSVTNVLLVNLHYPFMQYCLASIWRPYIVVKNFPQCQSLPALAFPGTQTVFFQAPFVHHHQLSSYFPNVLLES
jgi:hypothetical protein